MRCEHGLQARRAVRRPRVGRRVVAAGPARGLVTVLAALLVPAFSGSASPAVAAGFSHQRPPVTAHLDRHVRDLQRALRDAQRRAARNQLRALRDRQRAARDRHREVLEARQDLLAGRARGHLTNPKTSKSPNSPTLTGGNAGTNSNWIRTVLGTSFSEHTFCTFRNQNVSVLGGVVSVSYPRGSSAPSAGAPYGGAQVCAPFASGPKTDATLTYEVRIPVGFQFAQGGKMPGLYGGVEPFSGGRHNSAGWSARLMWRSGGRGEIYGYISTSSGYGDSWGRGNFVWTADGRWHTVSEHVHLNSPGHSDGWISLAYDGAMVINQTGLAITSTGVPINGLFFSTFFGGHGPAWASPVDQHIDFTGFRVS